jgi:hypothetical protein
MITEIKELKNIGIKNIKYCKDYDHECRDVVDTCACFLGLPFKTDCCGEEGYFGLADGVCKENEIRSRNIENPNT